MKRKISSQDIMGDFQKTMVTIMADSVKRQMRLRCLYEGCRYGIEGIDKKPLDHCIWCGEEKPKDFGKYYAISILDLINKADRAVDRVIKIKKK